MTPETATEQRVPEQKMVFEPNGQSLKAHAEVAGKHEARMCLGRTTGQRIRQLSRKRKTIVLSQQLSHLPVPSVSNIFSLKLWPGASELVPPPRKGWILEKGAYRPALREKLSFLLRWNPREGSLCAQQPERMREWPKPDLCP